MAKHGYMNIDGADPCEAMLDKAREVNAYRNYLLCATGNDREMPIPDGNTSSFVIIIEGHGYKWYMTSK